MGSMYRTSKKGGYRPGSGRPEGTGKYKERTRPIRIPDSLLPQIKALLAERAITSELHNYSNAYKMKENFSSSTVPLYSTRIAAGLPAYADDHIDCYLNFNEYLIERPDTTFCVRAEDNSMSEAGIREGDILVVDQALEPVDGKIVVASLNSSLLVKRLSLRKKAIALQPENPIYPTIRITKNVDFKIRGVVIYVIRSLL